MKQKKKIGEEQFKKYRRSWDMPPPPMSENSKYLLNFSPLNGSIPVGMTPLTESLKNTYERVVPYYDKEIKGCLIEGKNVLISAHGNSLRALCKFLFKKCITNYLCKICKRIILIHYEQKVQRIVKTS